MADRTPGGLFLVDADTRTALAAPAQHAPAPLPAAAPGERFTVHASSAYFVTDPTTWVCELDDPAVVVLAEPIADVTPLLIETCEGFARAARPFLLAAPAITGDAVLFLVANKLRGILQCGAVDADPATLARLARHAGTMMGAAAHGRARRATIAHGELALLV